MNQLLIPNSDKFLAYGDWLAQRITLALASRLRYQKRDGTWYSPRVQTVVATLSQPPFYYVVLDDRALFHFPRALLINERTREVLSAAVHHPVFAFLPEQCEALREALRAQGAILPYGVTYAIPLAPLRVLKAQSRGDGDDKGEMTLPRVAPLDISALPPNPPQPTVPIGITARGAWSVPLDEMGHTLIVGATGSGKSSWLHTALAALFTQTPPQQLRVALIDPKRNELALWARVPHRWDEIAYTPDQAARLLESVVAEMNRRGEILAGALCRDLKGYNQRAATPLPYLLVVIDECLDLVLDGHRAITDALKTIASRGRSAGVILWAATQHATAVEGLPRVMTLNLATRLVFRVGDATAARVTGCPQAHEIPRTIPGRMFAKVDAEPTLAQAFYVDEAALLAVVRAVSGDGGESPRSDGLTTQERELLAWAYRENGGHLTISSVEQWGLRHRDARRTLQRLEQMGVLRRGVYNRYELARGIE